MSGIFYESIKLLFMFMLLQTLFIFVEENLNWNIIHFNTQNFLYCSKHTCISTCLQRTSILQYTIVYYIHHQKREIRLLNRYHMAACMLLKTLYIILLLSVDKVNCKNNEKEKYIAITRSSGYWKHILKYTVKKWLIAEVDFVTPYSIYPCFCLNYLICIKEESFHFVDMDTKIQAFKLAASFLNWKEYVEFTISYSL